ncbi:DUF421 domain-containing protein [Leptolyngbya sp. FACHB-261]|nr:DUF421 domain-containing protein [Leptolyngbya sp. FACHB-261]
MLEHLTAEVITQAELRASLRRQGFEDLSEIKVAILETSGSLTVEPQRPSQDELRTQAIVEQLARIETGLSAISQQLRGGQ